MNIDWMGLFETQLYILKDGTDEWRAGCNTIQDLDVLAILMERLNIPIRYLSDGYVQLDLWRCMTSGVQSFESGRQAFFTNIVILSGKADDYRSPNLLSPPVLFETP